jgi:serine/threonine protein kinase
VRASGPISLSEDAERLLLGYLEGTVHVGNARVSGYKIGYVPDHDAWANRSPRAEPGGTIGDRFDIRDKVGSGAFADVYRAHDRVLDEPVAVKILRPPPDPRLQGQTLERMRREMRVMENHPHPHVMRLVTFGQLDDGRLWYVMPLADRTLEDDIRTLGQDPDTLLDVLDQIAAGVDHFAENGVVHRDLKPANILEVDGRWVVSDLGLVVDLSRQSDVLTGTGWAVGTPHNAPPESSRRKTQHRPGTSTRSGESGWTWSPSRRPPPPSRLGSPATISYQRSAGLAPNNR